MKNLIFIVITSIVLPSASFAISCSAPAKLVVTGGGHTVVIMAPKHLHDVNGNIIETCAMSDVGHFVYDDVCDSKTKDFVVHCGTGYWKITTDGNGRWSSNQQ